MSESVASASEGAANRDLSFQLRNGPEMPEPEQDDEWDSLDRILENYNFICHPEVRVKFKQQIKNYSLGVAVAKPWQHRPRVRVTLKPTMDQNAMAGVLQKVLLVPTHSQVCAFSKKLQFGWLRLQFMAGYNWARKTPTLDYRVTTKWSEGGRLKRKERYQVADSMLLRCKWNMDLHLPDMEGHLGANEHDLEPVDIDYGHLDFEISQVDMVLQSPLWRSRPPSDVSTQSTDQRGATTQRNLPGAGVDREVSSKQVRSSEAAEGPSSSSSSSSSAWRGAGEAQHPSVAGPRAWWQRLSKNDQADTDASSSSSTGGRNRSKGDGALWNGSRGGEASGSGSTASGGASGSGQPFADWLTSLKTKMGVQ